MASLESTGRVEERPTIELEKKLSLKFGPRFSKLVLTGLDNDFGYEVICLAALVNAGSSVFFRAGTDETKNKSDLLRTRFCHPDGDHLTLICVFEEWFNVPEKDKNKWCLDNSINAKVIRAVKAKVNQTINTIKKYLHREIKVDFKPISEIRLKIKDILFQSSKENIAFYLGHPKAGYLVPQQHQQAQIHPLSSVHVLGGSLPEWIIFEQHIGISRDVLTTVSPISRDVIISASKKGDLSFNIVDVEKLRVVSVCCRDLGRALFRAFVGPRYSNLTTIEAQLSSEMQGALVYIDADANNLRIKVHTNGDDEITKANRAIDQHLAPALKWLKSGDNEFPLHHKFDSVRGVIGTGAGLSAILYGGQYRSVYVEGIPMNTDPLIVQDLFSQYGEVIDSAHFKGQNPSHPYRWGSVTFKNASDAAESVARTRDCSNAAKAVASYLFCGIAKPRDFTLRLTWTRRKPRGFGFIRFYRPEDSAVFASQRSTMMIGQHQVTISLDRKTRGSIYMRNIHPSITEEEVVQVVNEHFQDEAAVRSVVEKVTIIRQAEFQTLDRDIQILQDDIQRQLVNNVPGMGVEVIICPPAPKNVLYTALLRFTNPDDRDHVYNAIHDKLTSMGEAIKVGLVQDFSTDIFVPRYMYKILKQELESIEQECKRASLDVSLSIVTRSNKAGHFYINIKSEDPDSLTRVRREYECILAGEVLDYRSCPDNIRILFDREGRKRLHHIKRRTRTIIRSDSQLWKIVVIGKVEHRQNAIAQIQNYIDIQKSFSIQKVELMGNNRPRGLMKHMLITYGTDLKGLQEKSRAESVELDFRRQVLVVRGFQDSVRKTIDVIESCSDKLAADIPINRDEDDSIECVICLGPIKRAQLCRLNLCGHAHCLDCAKRHLQTAVMCRTLPLKCVAKDCQEPWCWTDVEEIVLGGTTTISQIVSASVGCFVQRHQDQYHYCLTPDCPMVFPLSKNGELFVCEACELRICTTCKVQYHDGLTCADYKLEKADPSIDQWIEEDKTNRRRCPKCETPVEKNTGCQHLVCPGCVAHICWFCMETFVDDISCYGHLNDMHGTFG